ncbi:MAG: hypothetical protein V4598_19055 [Bdellovibrionota bacterium]
MTYYFISFDQSKFRDFPERFPVLNEGSWITSDSDLQIILDSADENTCFFIDFPKESKDLTKWVTLIRSKVPTARIIYVTGDQKTVDLKAHQLSPQGGDAYVSKNVSTDTLQRILGGFQNEIQNIVGNKLEKPGASKFAKEFELNSLAKLKMDEMSMELDALFAESIDQKQKPKLQSMSMLASHEDEELGVSMSDNDQELSLDDMVDLEISDTPDLPTESASDDGGLDMELDAGLDLELGNDAPAELPSDEPMDGLADLDLGGGEEMSLDDNKSSVSLSLGEDENDESGLRLDGTAVNNLDFGPLDGDLSPDAKEKLAEIDAIMDEDSKINLGIPADLNLMEDDEAEGMTGTGKPDSHAIMADGDALDLGGIDDSLVDRGDDEEVKIDLAAEGFELADVAPAAGNDPIDSDLDQPLVSDDIDLANLDFGMEVTEEEDKPVVVAAPKEEKTNTKVKKPKKEVKEEKEESRVVQVDRPMGQELREISGAYSAELERMQATLSNLRSDREELLAKIQTMEEDKLLHNRQTLTMRAELDEKKIELSIVRKKLNEDISDLKDRLRLEEERRLILEEKNRILREEVDKASQRSRIDVKKVQMRERELEGRLELLKADAETQIRNRDLKILELKRKIDAMEFDMESIQTQEKRTVESRFELEDKLEKAIKTLRGAISVLEDETDKGAALEALKKNIDM